MIELIVLIIIVIIVLVSRAGAPIEDELHERNQLDKVQIVPCLSIPASTARHHEDSSEHEIHALQIPSIPIIIPSSPSARGPDNIRPASSEPEEKKVKFAPRITVRTFNINNGEIIDQYNRTL